MNKWSNLPNAKHIDWVIRSLKDNPEVWDAAKEAARDAEYYATWNAVRDAATDAARAAATDAAYIAARIAAYNAARAAATEAAWYAARDAMLALMAYDDIEHYFLSSYEELRLIAELSQHPAAILLLPAIKARELIEAKNEQVV